ncbi:MAG TPA: HDOD domain-containing protein, partial [Deferrisomatales bacterium]|nr:HDOD domain-containing protein [Deferrisomatales bacterium]
MTDAPLPSLNVTVSRLLALYACEDYTPAAVIALLESDPAIAGRLLRLANSAYYGFESRVATLQRAVVLLGGV